MNNLNPVSSEVIFEVKGCAGLITLNRPKALNAVTLNIVEQMSEQLKVWATDAAISHVIIKAVEGRAFSAGGDIVQLYEWGQNQDPRFMTFYHLEYHLNTLIKNYPKPYIALIDGIVMGGGVGVSFNGSHRIVGDNVMFAMPETGIGLFPDVGGTYFLPRCPGALGMYLGLTGARLKAGDVLYAGLATHYVPSSQFAELEAVLCQNLDIESVLQQFQQRDVQTTLADQTSLIDNVFSLASIDQIFEQLEKNGDDWSVKTLKILKTKSPTSLLITFRQLTQGKSLTFEQAMALEYRLVSRIAQATDFFEGTRAVVIDKDMSPKWQPAALKDISKSQIDAYFAPLETELWDV